MFLTFVTFLPLIGAALLAFVPDEKTETIKQAALGIAVSLLGVLMISVTKSSLAPADLLRHLLERSALIGIASGGFFGIPDNALPTTIYYVQNGGAFAEVFPLLPVTVNGQQARYDGEGIVRDISGIDADPMLGGFFFASEGNGSSNPNLIVQTDILGQVIREIQLPFNIDAAADPSVGGNAVGSATGNKIRGNGFEGKSQRTTIESGKVADLGTIQVKKGRTIKGVVVADGTPVEGATVYVGRQIFGTGSSNKAEFGGPPGARDTRETTTDSAGGFVISGFGNQDLTIVAEHPDLGRSRAVRLVAGDPAEQALTVVIEPSADHAASV